MAVFKNFFIFPIFYKLLFFFQKSTKNTKTDQKSVKIVDKWSKFVPKKWSNFEKLKNATEQKRAFPYKSPNTPNSSLEFIQYSIKQVKTTLTRGFETNQS